MCRWIFNETLHAIDYDDVVCIGWYLGWNNLLQVEKWENNCEMISKVNLGKWVDKILLCMEEGKSKRQC
jgi:hypothetical protein